MNRVQKGNNVERTYRELLELAAKAAGFDIEDDEFRGEVVFADDGKRWAPLHDDGDALRLAHKLDISLSLVEGAQSVATGSAAGFLTEQGSDLAALRRAIVRAAAEIGSTMQDEQKVSEATNE